MALTIYHNPRCSKSRRTLALLRDRGVTPRIVLYLETPPDADAIEALLRSLAMEPRELLRRREAPYRDLGLADPTRTRDDLIAAMAAHPVLIERPIVTDGARAVLGRPPENVLALL